jgi:hypothetical protein
MEGLLVAALSVITLLFGGILTILFRKITELENKVSEFQKEYYHSLSEIKTTHNLNSIIFEGDLPPKKLEWNFLVLEDLGFDM